MKFWVGVLLAGLLGSGGLLSAQSSTDAAVSAAQALNAGQETPTPAKSPEAGQPQPTQASIQDIEPRVGVGDLIKVSVMGAPEYDQEVRVGGSGDVHLQLVGSVHIGGLTTTEAEQAVRTKLIQGGYFADPQVSIFEKEYATQGVSVFGEVHRPGVYPVTGPRRLFDMLSMAGGTTPTAGQTVSITHRDHPQSAQTVTMSRDPAQNVEANV